VALNRQFAASTLSVVREIEGKFFGGREICSTYDWHGVPDVRGVNGKPWGIDVWIAPYGQRANKTQEALGDSVQKFLEANWNRLGIHYVIYWGWMTYRPGAWFKYDPGTYNNPIASPDPDTELHMDHVHIQRKVNGPYSPPKDKAPVDKPGDLITLQQLAEISQNQNPEAYDLAGDIKALVPAMKAAQIVTKPRIAAFLANASHETDHLNTLEEYGDEAYFRSFLGNEWRYHGRGYLMNTWRAAYQRLSDIFGVDLVNNPDLLAKDKDLAARAATWFWTNNDLNEYADAGNFWAVSATINTGNPNAKSMNGWPERKSFYERALRVLPEKIPVAPIPPPTKPVEPPRAPAPAPVDLTRRMEALEGRVAALEQPAFTQPVKEKIPGWVNPERRKMEPGTNRPKPGRVKDRPYKAIVGAAIPFVMMFLTWYATGEFDLEEFVFLLTSLLSGLGVYEVSNRPRG
jgi:putative chitinase